MLQTIQRSVGLMHKIKSSPKLLHAFDRLCNQGYHGCLSSSSSSSSTGKDLVLYKLRSRGLVQLRGPDSMPFLQGLVTNDVSLLELAETPVQYSMLLNVQGRVMYDMLLYNSSSWLGEPSIWMECDRELADKLIADIKKYKIRKKVSINNISEERSVLAGLESVPAEVSNNKEVLFNTADPRVPAFGTRMLATSTAIEGCKVEEDETEYHERRLQWGIPEGAADLPPGNCFPLESNLVFMNGVSFSKGCYLGQELTARTHHTGATRKRLMPLIFDDPPEDIEPGANVLNAKGKNVGKLRSYVGKYGLGLIRMAEAIGDLTVTTKSGGTVALKAIQPDWWPKEGA